jgi:hypothetical protein
LPRYHEVNTITNAIRPCEQPYTGGE